MKYGFRTFAGAILLANLIVGGALSVQASTFTPEIKFAEMQDTSPDDVPAISLPSSVLTYRYAWLQATETADQAPRFDHTMAAFRIQVNTLDDIVSDQAQEALFQGDLTSVLPRSYLQLASLFRQREFASMVTGDSRLISRFDVPGALMTSPDLANRVEPLPRLPALHIPVVGQQPESGIFRNAPVAVVVSGGAETRSEFSTYSLWVVIFLILSGVPLERLIRLLRRS